MRFTYEVNLICSTGDCTGIVVSEPMETPQDARASAKRIALAEDWTFADGKATCPECITRAKDREAAHA